MSHFAPCPDAALRSQPLHRRHWLTLAAASAAAWGAPAAQARARKAKPVPEAPPVELPAPVDLMPPSLGDRLMETGLPLECFGLHAQPLDGGPAVLSWQAGRPFVLASTSKALTAMAALDLLGPNFRWRTRAYTTGPVTDGRLLGDLVIRGGGDASLTSADVLAWFRKMRSQGLQEVWGDIVLNRTAFQLTSEDMASTPEPSPEHPHHVRPDALALDAGVVRVAVQSDSGGRANIQITPPLHNVKLVNAMSRGGACVASAVYRNGDDGSMQPSLQVSGQWSPRCGPQQVKFAPVGMRDLSARAIESLWLEAGGVLRGGVVEHSASSATPWAQNGPDGKPVAVFSEHLSEPLSKQLRDMNKRSDNLLSRHVMLSLSPNFPNQAATAEGARGRMREWLRRKGLRNGLVGVDSGSGLSRNERATPQAMVYLLTKAAMGPNAKLFMQTLPVAGVDGTLEGRFRSGTAQGQAWLKTGTLNDTRALAGYVRTRSGQVMVVSLIANSPENVSTATAALDACVEWVARLA